MPRKDVGERPQQVVLRFYRINVEGRMILETRHNLMARLLAAAISARE
jgi:hypothetical protein